LSVGAVAPATRRSFPTRRSSDLQILAEKWNVAPEQRPVVGTDTQSDPALIENWYYAVWGYNGFTGPGSNRSNHPLDSALPWPRPDRKSTRLNSSHVKISYAVFCL